MPTIARLAFLTAAIAAHAPSALAQGQCTPIRFARGASSATVSGTATNMDAGATSACFLLETGPGQTARVRLTRGGPDTAFTIPDVVDNQSDYQFKTKARTYTISVYQTFRRTPPGPFTLEVAVR
ncbi:hypothetical protein [Roseicella sp. DB1501]|uniref:hypothetical protein n=1 Tax=Roseicella sp. DB1501 TaxID=2730925 RepID=UPI0014913576|nr:hypothetical protein [Roseicella sp. DB1501]NOG73756.1 hypothetical protein [Roseicella sp. DB1501]